MSARMCLLPYVLGDFRLLKQQALHQQSKLHPEGHLVPLHLHEGLSNGYYRPWRTAVAEEDVGSTVRIDKDKFQVILDVQHFSPEEITVKMTGDDFITVEGKHKEKEDKHGFISRQFVRKYILPKGHDIQNIASTLSSDGVLTITAPKLALKGEGERVIPVQQTRVASKTVESKK